MNRLKEIEMRLAAIAKELEGDTADITKLQSETDALIAERKEIIEKNEQRSALLDTIAQNHVGETIREFGDESKKDRVKTDEMYKRAFLKNLLNEEMTQEERAAFIHTTENTDAVIPTDLQDKIYATMEEKHPLLKDVQVLRTGTVISIVKHASIGQGDAKEVSEGQANDDEQNTFVNVTLSGKDFSKHVDFSYRLGKMAIPAFEKYLVTEISDRIGAAMTRDIVAQIKLDLAASNKISTATPGKIEMVDVLKALGALKQTGGVNVYMNNTSLYTQIANLEGAEGRLSFVPNYKEQISGQLIGKSIKEEDALADGEILFLDPSQFIYNVVQDIMLERDKNIKTHVHTIAGFAIAEGTMTNDKAGSLVTVTIGG